MSDSRKVVHIINNNGQVSSIVVNKGDLFGIQSDANITFYNEETIDGYKPIIDLDDDCPVDE